MIQRGSGLVATAGTRQRVHRRPGLSQRRGHGVVLGVHGREDLAVNAHGFECRPRDPVLAFAVISELIVEVRPRGSELTGPRPIARAE
jgi:hypothetical protein